MMHGLDHLEFFMLLGALGIFLFVASVTIFAAEEVAKKLLAFLSKSKADPHPMKP